MQFPTVQTADLNKRKLTLPQDFAGELTLAVIAYDQWQQRLVDEWVPLLNQFEARYPEFHYAELPVVGRMNPLQRYMLDGFMRGGIPAPETRARTITLYVERDWFNAQVDIASTETIVLLLLDAERTVVWRHVGAFSASAAAALEAEVARRLIATQEAT